MGTHRTRLLRLVAVAAATGGLIAGAGTGVAVAGDTTSGDGGGTPAANVSARDEHRPAGAGSGRKIGR